MSEIPQNLDVITKLRYYKDQALKRYQKEKIQFKRKIKEGKYPMKCLECYEIGIEWCRWWIQNFGCEEHEWQVAYEKLKRI